MHHFMLTVDRYPYIFNRLNEPDRIEDIAIIRVILVIGTSSGKYMQVS